jgi:hypothetical protein
MVSSTARFNKINGLREQYKMDPINFWYNC